jgi:NAD+ kinase
MRKFLIIGNSIKEGVSSVCETINKYVLQKGGECTVITGYVNREDIPKDVEVAVVIGGDGTLLQASRDLMELDIPLIGVNFGHLGFLADVEAEAVEDMIDRLFNDDFTVENRMMIEGIISRSGENLSSVSALNDIVIGRAGVMGVLDFKMYVNGIRLNNYKADGIIASTPTGSTAYNMSAGGPLVKPSAKLIVMTPVCPHTLNTRSIVFDMDDVIEIEICSKKKSEQGEDGYVYYDGDLATPLLNGDKIIIRKASTYTKLIKLDSRSFLEVLRRKLNNNEDSQA